MFALHWTRALLHAGVCLLMVGVSVSTHAAHDYIAARAWLEDKDGSYRVEQLDALAFAPTSSPLARGYTRSVTWMRIDLPPTQQPDLVLVVQPHYLDDVRLYTPAAQTGGDAANGWEEQRSGALLAYAERPRTETDFAFALQPSATQSTRYYLRVQTQSSTLVDAVVVTSRTSLWWDAANHLVLGVSLGVLLILVWLSLMRWWSTRNALWLYGLLYLVMMLAAALFLTGVVPKYLLPYAPVLAKKLFHVQVCLLPLATALLFLRLFETYDAPRWTTALFRIEVYVGPLLALMAWFGPTLLAMQVNSSFTVVRALWGLVAVWFVRFEEGASRWLWRSACVGLVLVGLYLALPVLGWAPDGIASLYPVLLITLLVSIVQYAGLLQRDAMDLRELENSRAHRRVLEAQLEAERARMEESASFLGMLLHELKTPLASIRLAVMSLASGRITEQHERIYRLHNIEKAVQDIDAVLERSRDTDRLEQGGLVVNPEPCNLADLLKRFAMTYVQSHRIVYDMPSALRVSTDITLVKMMLKNLLDNALIYSAPYSQVTLRVRGLPQQMQQQDGFSAFAIEVENEAGPAGLPDPARVFLKYYRAEGAHQHIGTGLGLYWVKGVATAMHGTVECQIDAPRVKFRLWIPC